MSLIVYDDQSAANYVAKDPVFGDLATQYASYDAMFSTITGDPSFVRNKTSNFRDLFASICSPQYGSEEGCGMFAVNFYGDLDRTLSIYEYQVTPFLFFFFFLI
jgi:hypothetical protein